MALRAGLEAISFGFPNLCRAYTSKLTLGDDQGIPLSVWKAGIEVASSLGSNPWGVTRAGQGKHCLTLGIPISGLSPSLRCQDFAHRADEGFQVERLLDKGDLLRAIAQRLHTVRQVPATEDRLHVGA